MPFCSVGVTVNLCKDLYLYKFSKKSEGKNKFYLYQSDKEVRWLLLDISFGYNLLNRFVFWGAKLLLPSQMHSNSVFEFVLTLGVQYFLYPKLNSHIKSKEEEYFYKGGWVTNIFSALFLTSSWHYYQSQAGFALNKDAAFSYSPGIFTTSYNTKIYKMV